MNLKTKYVISSMIKLKVRIIDIRHIYLYYIVYLISSEDVYLKKNSNWYIIIAVDKTLLNYSIYFPAVG